MFINDLTLKNFRGAASLSIPFDPHINVIVGTNGAGKSTALDALAIALSWLVNRIKSTGASGRPIPVPDIRNNTHHSEITIGCDENNQRYSWTLVKPRPGHSHPKVSSVLQGATELAKVLQANITTTQGHTNIPLLAYYPVNRAVLDIPLRIRKTHTFSLLDAHDEALTSGANFRTFFEWFREREDLENENRRYQNDTIKPADYQFPDPQLDAVRRALEIFMPDFKDLTVRRHPLRMEVEKNGFRLTVNQLSDGEKCLMAMIGDLARRLSIANPAMDNPLDGHGVVLIDEIDLHLHPRWQRMLIPRFRQAFPNCQLIASTHSPHVITHVSPKHLHLFSNENGQLINNKASESYGKNVDRVLEDLMGLETTRPDEVFECLQRIYHNIASGHLPMAKDQIDQLQKQIGNDPELVKASVLIKRKELIGK